MKRIVVLALAILMVAMSVLSFAACGKVMECELCGEEGRCKEVEIFKQKYMACADCRGEIEEAEKELEELGEDLKDLAE